MILAGGESRRMGYDKRFFVFRKQSLLERAYRLSLEVADEVLFLIAKPDDQQKIERHLGFPVRVIFDQHPNSGPMSALIGGLEAIQTDFAYLVAVDFPLLTGEFVVKLREYLLALNPSPKALIPLADGHLQVTCAFFNKSITGDLKTVFDTGERSISRWAQQQPDGIVLLPESEWQRWGAKTIFTNLNMPEDTKQLP